MSAFADRLRAGLDRVHAHAAVGVVYRRDGETIEELTAVPARSAFEAIDAEGLTTRRRVRDYKIDAAALVFGGLAVEPRSGDQIDETIDGVTVTFEVYEPGRHERSWRYADVARTRYRIHTREIARDC